jgi:predicted site-specific integrase-resolvase
VAPATISAQEFADLLGVAVWTLYKSVREGNCPIPPIRVGRRLVWSYSRVADLLALDDRRK